MLFGLIGIASAEARKYRRISTYTVSDVSSIGCRIYVGYAGDTDTDYFVEGLTGVYSDRSYGPLYAWDDDESFTYKTVLGGTRSIPRLTVMTDEEKREVLIQKEAEEKERQRIEEIEGRERQRIQNEEIEAERQRIQTEKNWELVLTASLPKFTNSIISFTALDRVEYTNIVCIKSTLDGFVYRFGDSIGGGLISVSKIPLNVLQSLGYNTNYIDKYITLEKQRATTRAMSRSTPIQSQPQPQQYRIPLSESERRAYGARYGITY